MAAIPYSLARANGWGSAGRAGLTRRQCPASTSAKTPAAREPGATSWRSLDSCSRANGNSEVGGDALPGGTAQLFQQLAELRAAARAYYVRSDLTSLTPEGTEAADQLARLLGYPEQLA